MPGSPPVEPNAQPRDPGPPALSARWLDLQMFDTQPLKPALSGLELEYRIIQLYRRDAGKREATFSFDTGQGTQDLGFRNEVNVLFDCQPARDITLRVRDENGEPSTASLLIRDKAGRVYPSQAKRLAPDFSFHPQVYRGDGETLQAARRRVRHRVSRGPESIAGNAPRRRWTRKPRELRFQGGALDRSGEARLVVRRSSHPRRRLRALLRSRPRAFMRRT